MEREGRKMIALDTNMLLAAEKFRVDVFEEIRSHFGKKARIFVPEEVEKEIDALCRKNLSARVAKTIIEKEKAEKISTMAKNADAALLELAEKKFIIATNDKSLKKKISEKGGKIIYLRKKKYLAMT